MTKNSNHQKFFVGISALVGAFFLWDAGLDTGRHFYVSMGIDFLMAAFWIGFGVLTFVDMMLDKELVSLRQLDRLFEETGKQLKELAASMHDDADNDASPSDTDKLGATAEDIYKEVTNGGGRAPTPEEVARIEQIFHDRTGWFTKMHLEDGGGHFEIQNSPFEAVKKNNKPKARDIVKDVKPAAKKGK